MTKIEKYTVILVAIGYLSIFYALPRYVNPDQGEVFSNVNSCGGCGQPDCDAELPGF